MVIRGVEEMPQTRICIDKWGNLQYLQGRNEAFWDGLWLFRVPPRRDEKTHEEGYKRRETLQTKAVRNRILGGAAEERRGSAPRPTRSASPLGPGRTEDLCPAKKFKNKFSRNVIQNFDLLTTSALEIKKGLSLGNKYGIRKEAQEHGKAKGRF